MGIIKDTIGRGCIIEINGKAIKNINITPGIFILEDYSMNIWIESPDGEITVILNLDEDSEHAQKFATKLGFLETLDLWESDTEFWKKFREKFSDILNPRDIPAEVEEHKKKLSELSKVSGFSIYH